MNATTDYSSPTVMHKGRRYVRPVGREHLAGALLARICTWTVVGAVAVWMVVTHADWALHHHFVMVPVASLLAYIPAQAVFGALFPMPQEVR